MGGERRIVFRKVTIEKLLVNYFMVGGLARKNTIINIRHF